MDFLCKLRRGIKHCGYPLELVNAFIRDRIVVGLDDKAIKRKLMETPNLTLEKTIDICSVSEITKTQLEQKHNDKSGDVKKS